MADVLAEAGLAHDAALGRALESLRALSPAEAPEPTGALAEFFANAGGSTALFAAPTPSRAGSRAADAALEKLAVPIELAAVRAAPRKRHRGAMISAAVVAGVGLSASGVAALGGVDYSGDAPSSSVRAAQPPAQSSAGHTTSADRAPAVAVPASRDTPVSAPATGAGESGTTAAAAAPRHRVEDAAQKLEDDARNALAAAETMIAQAVRGSAGRHSAGAMNDDGGSASAAQSQGGNASGQSFSNGAAQPSSAQSQDQQASAAASNQQSARHLELQDLGVPQAAAIQGAPRHLKTPSVLGVGL